LYLLSNASQLNEFERKHPTFLIQVPHVPDITKSLLKLLHRNTIILQPFSMARLIWLPVVLSILKAVWAQKEPQYQILPPLREQAALKDAWTKERVSHIPSLLQKYEVGAWLVS